MRGVLLIYALFSSLGSMHIFAAENGLAPAPDNAPSTLLSLNLNGSLRGSYWNVSNNPNSHNDIGIAELWLKAAPHLGNNATLLLEGWIRTPNAN